MNGGRPDEAGRACVFEGLRAARAAQGGARMVVKNKSDVIREIERAAEEMHEAIGELRGAWDRERDGRWRLDRAEIDLEMFLEDLVVEAPMAICVDALGDHERWLAHDAHDRSLRLEGVLKEIVDERGCDSEEAERARVCVCGVMDALRPIVSLSDHGQRLMWVDGVPMSKVLAWVSGRGPEPTAMDGEPSRRDRSANWSAEELAKCRLLGPDVDLDARM